MHKVFEMYASVSQNLLSRIWAGAVNLTQNRQGYLEAWNIQKDYSMKLQIN